MYALVETNGITARVDGLFFTERRAKSALVSRYRSLIDAYDVDEVDTLTWLNTNNGLARVEVEEGCTIDIEIQEQEPADKDEFYNDVADTEFRAYHEGYGNAIEEFERELLEYIDARIKNEKEHIAHCKDELVEMQEDFEYCDEKEIESVRRIKGRHIHRRQMLSTIRDEIVTGYMSDWLDLSADVY